MSNETKQFQVVRDTSVDFKDLPKVDTLDDLIKELRKTFDENIVNVEYVKALLSQYKSKPEEWKKYAQFQPHRYTRNLVDTGNGKYNLMALCWNEGQASSIHSHSEASCFVKMLDGQLKESRYEWPSDEDVQKSRKRCSREPTIMNFIESAQFGTDQVTYIHDTEALHRMENPSQSDSAVSLHLYVPPYDSCKSFDERTGFCINVGMPFWSEYGEKVQIKSGSGDFDTPDNN